MKLFKRFLIIVFYGILLFSLCFILKIEREHTPLGKHLEKFCYNKDKEICDFLLYTIAPKLHKSLKDSNLLIQDIKQKKQNEAYRFNLQDIIYFQNFPRLEVQVGVEHNSHCEFIIEYFAKGERIPSYFFDPASQEYKFYVDAWNDYFGGIDESVIVWKKGNMTLADLSPTAIGGIDLFNDHAYLRISPNEWSMECDTGLFLEFFSLFQEAIRR